MLAVIGQKVGQTQKFLQDGTRIPVTILATSGNTVMMHKTQDKDGYKALQLGFGDKKHANKPQMGQAKKAQREKAPLFMAETRLTDKEAESMPEVGSMVAVNTVFEAGDIVDVRGKSKGKGFAGGVKRYHFKGGPKTHGQSDRHRAPGSIGSGTTPGRVYKGKRMAGKMGNDMTTLKNLEVVKVGEDFVWVKGVVPGNAGAVVVMAQTGKKNKKFVEPMKTREELAEEEKARLQAEESVRQAQDEEAKKAAREQAEADAKAHGEAATHSASSGQEAQEEKPKVEEVVEEATAEQQAEAAQEVKTEEVAQESPVEEKAEEPREEAK